MHQDLHNLVKHLLRVAMDKSCMQKVHLLSIALQPNMMVLNSVLRLCSLIPKITVSDRYWSPAYHAVVMFVSLATNLRSKVSASIKDKLHKFESISMLCWLSVDLNAQDPVRAEQCWQACMTTSQHLGRSMQTSLGRQNHSFSVR